ncbi:hypothetical protein RND71_018718 [Anisodus tanguticus]|uniref:Uncharacterized protein n=1 Tax=Anisodus tanguticus TaxID=243964 RepID=A0AAE1S5B5_9SOLA|nr:hypothetical protein RND71_018718 [Anisodus tanguticus]
MNISRERHSQNSQGRQLIEDLLAKNPFHSFNLMSKNNGLRTLGNFLLAKIKER